MNSEGLIDSFLIANGTIKIGESSQFKSISITGESDLQFWETKWLDIDLINADFAFSAMRLLGSSAALYKKWSFALRISSVNVTKSGVFCGFGRISSRNPKWKTSFFLQCWWDSCIKIFIFSRLIYLVFYKLWSSSLCFGTSN